jgi:gluconokinase
MPLIERERARAPYCLALDVGTSSTRAVIFDGDAFQVQDAEIQLRWELIETPDGGLVGNADVLFDLVVATIDRLLDQFQDEIALVGTSCFWHSLLGIDRDGRAITPVYMWIDSRSRDVAARLNGDRGLATMMREQTGCRPHSSYWPAKLAWLQETDPELFEKVDRWVSFADFVMLRLTGTVATSIAMASGTGLLDVRHATWNLGLAGRFGVSERQLVDLVDRDEPWPDLVPAWSDRWPALASARWYPALGDGAAANVGAGCVGSDRIAMTIGTSAAMRIIVPAKSAVRAPSALWHYRLDRTHHVLGGALSNGGNVSAWIADLTADGDLAALSTEAESVGADGHGLTWLPFFAGERSPSWDDRAFGTLLGLRFATQRGEIFRAALEGTAYRLAAVYDDLATIATNPHTIHANGGAALNSPLWMQVIADTFDHDLLASDAEAEISARGAAVSALQAAGVMASLRPDTIPTSATYAADSNRHAAYSAARKRQARLEQAIRDVAY